MARFEFPYHTFETEYPPSGTQIQMGKSWTFTAPPEAPNQRKFTLHFEAMVYFVSNGQIDASIKPEINLAAMENFYNEHQMHETFTYKHPVYGDLPCRFSKPLKIPKGTKAGNGVVENIEIELIEVPGMANTTPDLIDIVYEELP